MIKIEFNELENKSLVGFGGNVVDVAAELGVAVSLIYHRLMDDNIFSGVVFRNMIGDLFNENSEIWEHDWNQVKTK